MKLSYGNFSLNGTVEDFFIFIKLERNFIYSDELVRSETSGKAVSAYNCLEILLHKNSIEKPVPPMWISFFSQISIDSEFQFLICFQYVKPQ